MTKRIGLNPNRLEKEHLNKLGLQSVNWLKVSKQEWTWLLKYSYVGESKEVRVERWL